MTTINPKTIAITHTESNKVWAALCGQHFADPTFNTVHPLFHEGWHQLNLSTDRLPTMQELDSAFFAVTGWHITKVEIQYLSDPDWFTYFSNKTFPVTQYIRHWDDLTYTPLPDILHDVFGHLAFLTHPLFAELAHTLGRAYLQTSSQPLKDTIANTWWFTFEFGLLQHQGQPMMLGAGLVSSLKERAVVVNKQCRLKPFTLNTMRHVQRSAHSTHQELYILDSIKQLEQVVHQLQLESLQS